MIKKSAYIILSIFLLFAFSGCRKKQGNLFTYTGQINIKRNFLTIHLDNLTSFGSETIICGVTDNQELIFANTINHSIDYYGLNSGRLERRINIPKEGEGAIDILAGCIELSSDSILIFNKYILNGARLFSKLNNEAVLDKHFFGNWNIYNNNIINLICSALTPPIWYDNNLFFLTWPIGVETLENEIVEFKYQYYNKNLMPTAIKYPKLYLSDKYPFYLALPTRTFNYEKAQLVYSWPLVNEIGIFELNREKFQWMNIKNSSVSSRFTDGNSNNIWHTILQSGHYNGILYDESKNLYYRFYFSPADESTLDQTSISDQFPVYKMSISIQVINNIYEEIGRIDLPGSIYDFAKCFVNKGKLFLAMSNPYNDKLDENTLRYDILEIFPN